MSPKRLMSVNTHKFAVAYVAIALRCALILLLTSKCKLCSRSVKRRTCKDPSVHYDLWPERLILVAVLLLRAESLYCCVQSSTLWLRVLSCCETPSLPVCVRKSPLFIQQYKKVSVVNSSFIILVSNRNPQYATWFITSWFPDNRILERLFSPTSSYWDENLSRPIEMHADRPIKGDQWFPRGALFSKWQVM